MGKGGTNEAKEKVKRVPHATVMARRHCPPSLSDFSPSCHPSSFVCAAVLLVDLHSLIRRGTLLSSPLALKSTQRTA
jgi:hypothetical protein